MKEFAELGFSKALYVWKVCDKRYGTTHVGRDERPDLQAAQGVGDQVSPKYQCFWAQLSRNSNTLA